MKLSKILSQQSIQIPLQAKTKNEALKEMSHLLCVGYNLENEAEILEKVLAREQKMSTGIGFGVAVPHAKHENIQEIKVAVGVSREGIPFDAIDDENVHLLFIMISPVNTAGPHVQMLSAISKIMSYEDMRSQLRDAKDADDFLKILAEGEEKYL
jgi:mannitol/fructose-specific phosphotransferase system IIA component (Ntr-type)